MDHGLWAMGLPIRTLLWASTSRLERGLASNLRFAVASKASNAPRSPDLRFAVYLVLLLTLCAAPGVSAAAPPTAPEPQLDLTLTVSGDDGREIRGVATWTFVNGSREPLATLPVSLYANRFAAPPTWLSGLTWFRVFPGGFDPGGTRIAAARIDGVSALVPPEADRETVVELRSPRPLAPGATVSLELEFTTRVPERWGPFGLADGVTTLEGGFYPAPLLLEMDGPRRDVPPPRAAARVTLQSEQDTVALLAGRRVSLRAGETAGPFELPAWRNVSLQLRTAAERLGGRVGETKVDVFYPPPRRAAPVQVHGSGARDPLSGAPAWRRLEDLGWQDRPGAISASVADALRFLEKRAPGALPARVALVEAPLRRHLALPGAAEVWLSDRLLRVTPIERLQRFHRIALVRALYAYCVRETVAAREPAEDRAWVADVLAEHLTRAFVVARWGVREDAFDVLAPGAFLAVVDDVLYAPQMPFQSAYFNVVDDTDPARDRYRLFFGTQPTGRRVYERIRDELTAEQVTTLLDGYLAPRATTMRAALGALEDVRPDVASWLAPFPPQNLRLVGVSSELLEGTDRYVHRASIVRVRPAAEAAAAKDEEGTDKADASPPVTVRFRFTDGSTRDARWDGQGETGTVEIAAELPLSGVEVDPEGRVPQWLPGVADDLRLDDRDGAALKILLGRMFLTTTPTSGDFSAQLEVLFQRRHDIRHKFGVMPFVAPGKAGASVFHTWGFGPRVTANRLAGYLSSAIRLAAVERGDDDGGDGWGPGLVAQLTLGHSDAVTAFDSRRQTVGYALARYVLSPGASGSGGGDDQLHAGQFVVSGAVVRSPHARHRLGARFTAGGTVGDVALGERLRLGGLQGVRAIGPSEWRGRHAASLGFEYRHTWTRSLSTSVAHVAWLEGLEGVLFADAGVSGDTLDDLVTGDALAAGVGYGLRFHGTLFGVQPSMIALDFAYALPVTNRLRDRSGPPLALHLYFTQSF